MFHGMLSTSDVNANPHVQKNDSGNFMPHEIPIKLISYLKGLCDNICKGLSIEHSSLPLNFVLRYCMLLAILILPIPTSISSLKFDVLRLNYFLSYCFFRRPLSCHIVLQN